MNYIDSAHFIHIQHFHNESKNIPLVIYITQSAGHTEKLRD